MFVYGNASPQLFLVMWILLRSLGVIFYNRWVLSDSHKNYFKDWCLMNSQPTFLFFSQFKFNELWTYYQKHVNQTIFNGTTLLTFSFTNIWGLHSKFPDCKSFLESNSPDILALCETNLDDSIDSGNFSVTGYFPLIRKDSSTNMHGLRVYVKGELPFAGDLSLGNSVNGFSLELMYISLIENTRSSLTHLHGLQLFVLLL